MRLLQRSGVCALALVAGTAALQFEPAVLRDLVFDNGSHRMAVGAVRVPLWAAARAQSPETFSLENVRLTFGSTTYEAQRVDFSGVASSRAEVDALLSASSQPLAERLARISAREIRIPELKVRQKVGPETQATVYKNVLLADVLQGRIGQATVGATGVEISDEKTSLTISYGRMAISDVDMPAFARLYETKAVDAASAPLTRIHGAFSIDDIDMVDEQGLSIKVARLAGRDFLARPTRESWTGTTEQFVTLGSRSDDLTEDEQARLLSTLGDFLGAFDIGFIEATGFELKDPSNDGATGRIRRLAYTGATGTQPADARAEGFEVTDKDGSVKIETMSLTGFSLKPTIEALRTTSPDALRDLDPAAMRTLLPTLGTLRISGVDIDTLDKDSDAKSPERIKATLKEFEFTADDPFNSVPTNIRVGLQNFAIALPANSQEDGIKDLLALGYATLDLSFMLSAGWDETTSQLTLREVSAKAEDMGSFSLTGVLGNVGKDVFDPDTAVATVALVDARAKSLELTVQNTGLFDRFLAQTAEEQKTTPEALRRSYGTIAAVAIPSMLGNSEQAKTLSQAVARFIAKPGRLTISAEAKEPGGLGVADLIGLTEPAAALEKLNITAKVE
ncbi:hypothetical protein [Microvirga lenta]|uniref:hypothetical protein n=1 Tax=Microvirga lenta TaxID=2881337 RepID=UPI001CFF8AFB|nr:hypothetical protein [Microvirga lenta]MCB5177014.1 hypothetical protein [Microvirga lenta]